MAASPRHAKITPSELPGGDPLLKKWTPGRARELPGASKYDSTARIGSRKDVGGVTEASSKLEQLFLLLSTAGRCVVGGGHVTLKPFLKPKQPKASHEG